MRTPLAMLAVRLVLLTLGVPSGAQPWDQLAREVLLEYEDRAEDGQIIEGQVGWPMLRYRRRCSLENNFRMNTGTNSIKLHIAELDANGRGAVADHRGPGPS